MQLTRVGCGVYDLEATPPQHRSAEWARQCRWPNPYDVYQHRRRRATLVALFERGPHAVAVGLGALALHGIAGVPLDFTPSIVNEFRSARNATDSSQVRRYRHLRSESLAEGIRLSPLPDALAQGLLELSQQSAGNRDALAIADSIARRNVLTGDFEREFAERLKCRRGARNVRWIFGLRDQRSESPAESWARYSCITSQCPPDQLQLTIVNAGGEVVARVDMAWQLPDGSLLLVEIDGAEVHSAPGAVYADRTRQNSLVSVGKVLRFTGGDAWHGQVGHAVARELSGTGWIPGLNPLPQAITLP
ncbi:MAG: hypothetical protein LBH13_06095 [Cellulomonadaceae bacterium]|nr:hypothetical protein [Cellulomonadaceae bacterium]